MPFKSADMLTGKAAEQSYREGDKATILGHLKEMFLFGDDPEYIEITAERRKKYNKAIDILRRIAKISGKVDLETWETTLKPGQAAKLLNQIIKEMEK